MRNRNYYPWSSLQGPTPPNVPQQDCPPRNGYTIFSENEMASIRLGNTQQVFSSLPFTTFPEDNTQLKELHTVQLNSNSEILWLVTVNAIEVIQTAPDPVRYLTTSEIRNFADGNPPRYSIYQARIRWNDGSAYQHYKYIDIKGGSSFQVFARSVSVDLLAPDPTYYIINGEQTPATNTSIPPLDGLVVNAIVSARIAPQDSAKSSYDVQKFTKRVNTQGALAAEPAFVEIPPGAMRVKIYNCRIGVGPTEMYFWVGTDATLGYTEGIIDFTGDSTDYMVIPAGATHIYTGPTNNAQFKFVFEIDP